MPHQPASRSAVARSLPWFHADEWDLLVRLPGRVLLAAAAGRSGTAPTVAGGLAGLDAIASGRTSASDLVARIVGEIYAEQLGEGDPTEFTDPRSGIASVLADCRAAARTLQRRASAEDAAAYRDWLVDVAAAVRAGTALPPAAPRLLLDLTLALTV
jgi:hypothetical protein